MKLSEIKTAKYYNLHESATQGVPGRFIAKVQVVEKIKPKQTAPNYRVRVRYVNDLQETTKLVNHRHLHEVENV